MLLIGVLTAALLAAPLPERGNLSGAVAIEFGPSTIAVYVDTNRDDLVDQRFQLAFERDSAIAARTSRHFESATVEFASDYARVISDGEAFEFVVEGLPAAERSPTGTRVSRWIGYGLSHTIWESRIAIKRAERGRSITAEWCDATSDCDPE